MDATEQIKKFQEFFDLFYKEKMTKAAREDAGFIIVDFTGLSRFDPELAEILLEEPEEVLKAAEIAIEQFDLGKEIRIRLSCMPESQKILIRNIRAKHIGKLLVVEGVVRQKSDVRPQVTSAKFECPNCGNVINVLQLDSTFKEPTRCGCGRKGKFRMISKEMVDAQGLVLEEPPELLDEGQPKRMNVLLKGDLVSPLSERRTNPGAKVSVTGSVQEVPIITNRGLKSTRFDLIIEANNVEAAQTSLMDLEVTPEEEEQIKALASDPHIYDRLVDALAPSIYGYERIKGALLLQQLGGVRKIRNDKVTSRGDMHILLVGDPGAGKSALLKRVANIAPKGRYVSGKGASGAGLTASVVKDEFLKGWSLEAGAMVLASGGLCVIDEMDKMSKEDASAMHEALENQTVSISKANIQATLVAQTTVLAAANPKFGRFDPYGIVAEQIDMVPTLINRFDLIFTIKDLPDEAKDRALASHMLNLHQDPTGKEAEINTDLLRKYIAYAKQRSKPQLTDEAVSEIESYYIKMRMSGSGDSGVKTVPISARQLEALVRMSEASAKVKLSDKVTKKDARQAIELLEYCLMEVGFDRETGKIDIDRIATGVSASQRSQIATVKEIINSLEGRFGKAIPIDEIITEAASKNISEERVEETIEKLKRAGDVFEPRHGFVSKI